MTVRRLAGAVAVLAVTLGGLLLAAGPAQAQDTESFADPGPVSLAGTANAESPNAGEHVVLGSVELGPGVWTITASVRLFVNDPDPAANDGRGAWKNSQGCGLYAGDTQLGGAGGSSGLWTAADGGGKEVVFATFLVPPDWTDTPIVLPVDSAATVRLECFIDQSHGGATFEQRASFAATDIGIEATSPGLCEVAGLENLLADDEKCEEPEPTPTPTVSPTPSEPAGPGGSGDDPELAVTGIPTGLMVTGAVALGTVGGGLLLAARRRRPTFSAE